MFAYPVRIALIAALGGFLFGFETVVISGAEETLEHLWKLGRLAHGFTVSSSLLGTILGSLVAGAPAKRYGRKKSYRSLPFFLSWQPWVVPLSPPGRPLSVSVYSAVWR